MGFPGMGQEAATGDSQHLSLVQGSHRHCPSRSTETILEHWRLGNGSSSQGSTLTRAAEPGGDAKV